ncbi:HNH endonuclease [Pseudomonas atacamensis]|uniref:HNH endonuclease n=1 Tax=Pseudomonas atacamensis TaxID=2565368 RepID=UPI003CE8B769
MLTLERVNELLRYDPGTGQLFWKLARRNGSEAGSAAGCASNNGYTRVKIDGVQYLAHRLAWFIHYSEWPTGPIDHVDTVRANNSISNLRVCTGSQNQQNQPLRKSNRSGIKGVSWCSALSRWHVQIRAAGRIHQGGYFIAIDDAESAAIQLRTRLHGEFARHA